MVVRGYRCQLHDAVARRLEAAVLQPHPLRPWAVNALEECQHPRLLARPGGAIEEQVGDLAVLRLTKGGLFVRWRWVMCSNNTLFFAASGRLWNRKKKIELCVFTTTKGRRCLVSWIPIP